MTRKELIGCLAGCFAAFAAGAGEPQYLVVDLEKGGSVMYVRTAAELPDGGLANDAYRTTRLVLRRIPAKGKDFLMGSPKWEIGHDCHKEAGHEGWDDDGVERRLPVRFSRDYFIGIYPVTQRQYELLTGTDPSHYKGAMRPVESVSFLQVRGTTNPRNRKVAPESFLGKLRAKAGGLPFDLPTEAQWEFACRAGTETGFNNGTSPLSGLKDDPNASVVGRHWGNGGKKSPATDEYWSGDEPDDRASPRVGSYVPNAWGLYDMHGGVYEWCLDWFDSYLPAPGTDGIAHDPVGPATGTQKILRGGSFGSSPVWCRSAGIRWCGAPKIVNCTYGFRIALTLEPAPKEVPRAGCRLPDVDRIVLPGAEKYSGHLQDVWFDGTNIYWTHMSSVFRTDRFGKVLAKGDAPGLHAAGCQTRDGKLYAALCDMGKWERQGPTPSDPLTVRVFDAKTLAFIEDKTLEVNDFAGSFTFLDDGTCLIGCLRAKDIPEDQVRYHHFDRNFKLIKTHVHGNLKVPHGIEVIRAYGDFIYLAIYRGDETATPDGIVVKLDRNFNEVARFNHDGQMGLIFDGPYVWTGGAAGARSFLLRGPVFDRDLSAVCRDEDGPKVSVFESFIRQTARERGISIAAAADLLYELGIRGFDCSPNDKDLAEFAATKLKPINFYVLPNLFASDGGRADSLAFFDTAEKYGVPQCMIIPPNFTKDGDSEEEFKRILSGMKMIVAEAKKRGITITVEDFGGTDNPCSHVKYLKRLLDEIPELRFALDSGNLYYAGRGDDILKMMAYVKDRIGHVHLKDQRADDNRAFETLGLGAVPNEKIVKAVNGFGYGGWYTLENAVGADTYADAVRQVAVLKSWLEGK